MATSAEGRGLQQELCCVPFSPSCAHIRQSTGHLQVLNKPIYLSFASIMESGNTSPWPPGFGTRPWLIQAHGRRREAQTFVDMLDRSRHEVTIPEMQGKICLGCVHDGCWLLMLDEDTFDCFLLSVTPARAKIPLPPLRLASEYKGTCGVPSHPESDRSFLLCCRPGDGSWTDLLAGSDDAIKIDADVVAHAGKLYASTTSGDHHVAIDVAGGGVRTLLLRTGKEEEALRGSHASRLVESCGDIFALRMDYFGIRPSDSVQTRIVVYRLDLSDWVWRRVESIGRDRAFLVSGDYALSCSAAAARLQGNCVHVMWSSCDCERLYKYLLDDMTITLDQILPEHTTPTCRAYWVVPTV